MVKDRMMDMKQIEHSIEHIHRKWRGIDLFPLDPLGGSAEAIAEILEPVTRRVVAQDHLPRGEVRKDRPAQFQPRQ